MRDLVFKMQENDHFLEIIYHDRYYSRGYHPNIIRFNVYCWEPVEGGNDDWYDYHLDDLNEMNTGIQEVMSGIRQAFEYESQKEDWLFITVQHGPDDTYQFSMTIRDEPGHSVTATHYKLSLSELQKLVHPLFFWAEHSPILNERAVKDLQFINQYSHTFNFHLYLHDIHANMEALVEERSPDLNDLLAQGYQVIQDALGMTREELADARESLENRWNEIFPDLYER